MKKFLTLILIFLSIGSRAQTPSKELLKATIFNGLEDKVKPGYGTKLIPYLPGLLNTFLKDQKCTLGC